MSRILITYDVLDGCNQVNLRGLVGILSACNSEHTIFHKPESLVSRRDLEKTDMLFLIRPMSLSALELAKAARRSGIFLCIKYDDDLLNIPHGPHYQHFHWRCRYAKYILACADMLVCSNALLRSEYKSYMKRPRAINISPYIVGIDERFAPVVPSKKILRVIYAAGNDHKAFFDKTVGPAMKPLLEKYSDTFEFVFLGVKPDLSLIPEEANVKCLPMLSYDEYIDFMKRGKFDIGLAPLEDTPFSSRKGIVKYIDYSIVGTLGIYSNCMPYNGVIHSGENGFLVDNTSDDWLVTLSFCAENPERVKHMAKTAQDDLLNNYLPDSLVSLLKDEAPEFFSTIRDKSKKVRLFKNPFSHFLYAFRKNWNEKIIVSRLIWPLAEKARNISEQINTKGIFGATKYYCQKVIMANNDL